MEINFTFHHAHDGSRACLYTAALWKMCDPLDTLQERCYEDRWSKFRQTQIKVILGGLFHLYRMADSQTYSEYCSTMWQYDNAVLSKIKRNHSVLAEMLFWAKNMYILNSNRTAWTCPNYFMLFKTYNHNFRELMTPHLRNSTGPLYLIHL